MNPLVKKRSRTLHAIAGWYAAYQPGERPTQIVPALVIRGTKGLIQARKNLIELGVTDRELNLTPEGAQLLLEVAAWDQEEREGALMSAYPLPKSGKHLPPVDGPNPYYAVGTFRGKPAYSNGHLLLAGQPPPGIETQKKKMRKLVDGSQRRRILPVGYTHNPHSFSTPRRVYFDNGMVIDANYYEVVVSQDPEAQFWGVEVFAEEMKSVQMAIHIRQGRSLVGLLMPLRPSGLDDLPPGIKKILGIGGGVGSPDPSPSAPLCRSQNGRQAPEAAVEFTIQPTTLTGG